MAVLRSPRIWLAVVVVAILIAVALWPSARLIDTGRVDHGPVRESVDAEGRTRVVDRYQVTAPAAARARRLELEPGDPVELGQVLVVLDPVAAAPLDPRSRGSAEAAIAAAQARLAGAEQQQRAAAAVSEQARADAERLTALAARGLVAADVGERAATERELAERALASARFARATAAHELELARAALRFGDGETGDDAALHLRAPVAGVLLRRHFESERPVQAGEVLIEIGDPAHLEAEIEVLSADAVRLREGMDVELLRWGEPQPLLGRIRRIEPGGFTKFSALGVEEQRVWVIVELTSPQRDWQRLGDAYRIHARFILRQVEEGLRAPTSAVFRDGDGHAVFQVEAGRARRIPVVIGLQGDGYTEILSGLTAEAVVIVHPDRIIEDGDRVRSR